MEISRRTDYAMRLLAALVAAKGRTVSVRDIAQNQDVPYAFARSIEHALAQAGIISTSRGAKGGMILAKQPNEFTLFEVVECVQGPVGISVCTREEDWCVRAPNCRFHGIWQGADQLLREYLSSITFAQALGLEPRTDPWVGKIGDFPIIFDSDRMALLGASDPAASQDSIG
ncbi:MAG: Rrf2 family transcriptional regulator [Coriobacteriales bacterium]|nr:Rrf2 family transcriptional regulator [Coriobacteriales bacterium]